MNLMNTFHLCLLILLMMLISKLVLGTCLRWCCFSNTQYLGVKIKKIRNNKLLK